MANFHTLSEKLKAAGCRIDVLHTRLVAHYPNPVVLPRGGRTTVKVTLPSGYTLTKHAQCSNLDNFNKRIGREVAMGRIAKEIQESGVISISE